MLLWIFSLVLAAILLFCLLTFLLRFEFAIEVSYPGRVQTQTRICFLSYTKKILSDSDSDYEKDFDDDSKKSSPHKSKIESQNEDPRLDKLLGLENQAGFIRIPFFSNIGPERWKRSLVILVTDLKVWKSLIAYAWRSFKRIWHLLKPRIEVERLRLEFRHPITMAKFCSLAPLANLYLPYPPKHLVWAFGRNKVEGAGKALISFRLLGLLYTLLRLGLDFPWWTVSLRTIRALRKKTLTRLQKWLHRLLLKYSKNNEDEPSPALP